MSITSIESLLEQKRPLSAYAANHNLPAILNANQESDSDQGMKTMKSTLLEAVNQRFSQVETEPPYCIVTMVDPRYKHSQTVQRRHFLPTSGKTGWPQGGDSQAGQVEPAEPQAGGAEPVLPNPMAAQRPCGCANPCISDLGLSDWFSQRYNPQQPLILNTTDNKLTSNALKWWLQLQLPRDKQPLEEAISQMFQIIPPPTVDFKPLPSHCRSCAVVGNSGNLLRSRYGRQIDSHSVVIRMNKAVTQGFEQDVGNRTTHHFLYPESAVDLEQGVSLVLLPYKLRDLQWMTSALSTGHITMTYRKVRARVKADKDKILVVNPVFLKYVHDHWNERHGHYPSTGMLTLIFALHMCDQVSVFGYGADQRGDWHHYWEDNLKRGMKTGHHNGKFEMQVIQRLAEEGKISLHL
ncbi:CMP-N-acetylneuraminate-beta-galactosamide-alpha-2,3-sialyltransferase 1-like [Centroberyx affinis]|uniref:CMP-N-acetylneuraminate-beta-galactosamide- alpha-2,3-sialyltransferase 1-like n=1 Tax=Centroberyx affinis TaxID=166261 RepID=UPI003A5BCADF